jgi:hypothetical protein
LLLQIKSGYPLSGIFAAADERIMGKLILAHRNPAALLF